MATKDKKMKTSKRLCIIGAGPSGIAVLNAFDMSRSKGEEIPEIVCFEKQSEEGGLFNYTWRIGVDEYGEPLANSAFFDQWSMRPRECLENDLDPDNTAWEENCGYEDYPSFVPRAFTEYYLKNRVRYQVRHVDNNIQLNHVVRYVKELDDGEFEVTYENLKERGMLKKETFSHVVVANGHFSVPHVPNVPNIENYQGHILHSHDFRNATFYEGKRIVLVGSGHSAEDIALQLYKYGSREVIISYRNKPIGFNWPEGIREVPAVKEIYEKTVIFWNEEKCETDAIIFCTGYEYSFPFLPSHLQLATANVLYPDRLYKGVVFNDYDNLFYMGMQKQWYTLTMLDAEACFLRDVILEKIAMPSNVERIADIKKWRERQSALKTVPEEIDFQHDYIADLLSATGNPTAGNDQIAVILKRWHSDREADIQTYRDKNFESIITGYRYERDDMCWIEDKRNSHDIEGFVNP